MTLLCALDLFCHRVQVQERDFCNVALTFPRCIHTSADSSSEHIPEPSSIYRGTPCSALSTSVDSNLGILTGQTSTSRPPCRPAKPPTPTPASSLKLHRQKPKRVIRSVRSSLQKHQRGPNSLPMSKPPFPKSTRSFCVLASKQRPIPVPHFSRCTRPTNPRF